jgi:hypothetical protein
MLVRVAMGNVEMGAGYEYMKSWAFPSRGKNLWAWWILVLVFLFQTVNSVGWFFK